MTKIYNEIFQPVFGFLLGLNFMLVEYISIEYLSKSKY